MSSSARKSRSDRRVYELNNGMESSNETSTGILFPTETSDTEETAKAETQPTETTKLLPKPVTSTSSSLRKLKLFQIYRYADKWDILAMVIGFMAALASGATFPLISVVYQRIANAFVALGRNETNHNQTDNILHGCRPPVLQVKNKSEFVSPYDEINSIIIWYPILGACCFVLYCISYNCWIITSERQVRRIRYILFDNIMRQNIGWFDTQTSSNLSTGLLVESLDSIRDGIGFKVADFTILIARIVGSLAYALYAGWKLTLMFLSVSPLIIITFNASVIVMKKYTIRETTAYNQANSIVHEVLLAIRTVTTFGGQRRELERYKKSLIESKRMGHKKGLLLGISQAFVNIAAYGSIALIFWYGPYLARVECWNYNAGIFIVIFTSCLASINNISMIIPPLFEFAQASAASARVFAIIDRKSSIDIADHVNHEPNTKLHGQIELRDIVFNYPSRKEHQPILQRLSLKFAAGTTTAIIGETGCGKSTIIQLIQRFYDPEQGQVLFDGVDARHLDLKWLRSQIGIVSQEPVLFSGTIEDNIRLGNISATDDDVRNAARLAKIDEFIEGLPLKYKTPITGRDFSGGQKQRMAIARALVSKPKILLLDEATSALDTRGEREVQEALEEARHGRTTIVIAHRLSTIRMVDLIIGLERGGVVSEQGTHGQLMARGGNYARALAAQQVTNIESHEEDEGEDSNEFQQDDRGTLQRSTSISLQHSITSLASATVPLLNDDDETNQNVSKKPLFLRILALNSHEWFSILLGSVASLIFGVVMPSFSLIFSLIFGLFSEPDSSVAERNSRNYSIIVFCIGVAGGLCQLVSSIAFAHSGEALTVRMRVLSFSTILRQEMSWFEQEHNRHGVLVTRLASDAVALKGMTGVTIGAFLNAIGTLIAALVISFNDGWKFTLVLLCFTPLVILAGVVQGSTLAKAGQKRNVATNAEIGNTFAAEALQNIRTVISLNVENYFVKHYKKAYDDEFRYSMKHSQRIVFASALANSLMFFIHAVAFSYGARLVHNGEMSYVKVFQVFGVITYATLAFGRSISMVPNYNRATQAAKRTIALTEQQSLIDPQAIDNGLKLETVQGKFEFRHVSHCYVARSKIHVLHNLSLTCAANSQTAIVGPSGSGKSTCVALMQRFYDPIRGSVYLDGHDLRTLNVQWLRSIMGIVQQEPVLFNMSIRDNIAYGDISRTVTDSEIEDAARQANIHDMIVRLAQGYNTMCGSEGQVQLAGGQKQRIAIARMLIRHPKIVLFDEATSALDVETEKTILATMEHARRGRTCVTIAHRLSTIRHSDQIAVLVRGGLHEKGTHEELMAHGEQGTYYTLIKAAESSLYKS